MDYNDIDLIMQIEMLNTLAKKTIKHCLIYMLKVKKEHDKCMLNIKNIVDNNEHYNALGIKTWDELVKEVKEELKQENKKE